jgi:hypothetical protein
MVSTTGTPPAQIASEGTAILADRSALLTCQSGSWIPAKSASIQVLYLMSIHTTGYSPYPPSCPSGWAQSDFGEVAGGGANNYRRTCIGLSTRAPIYLESIHINGTSTQPAACPVGWVQADYNEISVYNGQNFRRVCI